MPAQVSTFSSFDKEQGRDINQDRWKEGLKVTRPSYFVRVPSCFEALWYPHPYFDRKSNI